MKLSQKKTCEGCRAFVESSSNMCELGFNNRGRHDAVLGMNIIQPQEPCYKPLTIAQLYEAKDIIQKQHG